MSQLPTLSVSEITSERVVLRKAREGDRAGLIDLQTDPPVRAYLGGPRARTDVEQYLDAVGIANVAAAAGVYIIADRKTDLLLGTLQLTRRSGEEPGHLTEDGEELELGYLLRHEMWGSGFAFEAATCALRTAAAELPDQPVLIVTQTANERSLKLATRLGFRPVSTFEAFGAQQTLATAALHAFADPRPE
ncbi:GNAT family N-acetyltransferase [Nocardia brasiliensis]